MTDCSIPQAIMVECPQALDGKEAVKKVKQEDTDLQHMEEGYEATSADHEQSITNIEQRVLGGRPFYLNISKEPGFAAILLSNIGPAKVSSLVVNTLFHEIDEKNNGWISAADLSSYLCRVGQFGIYERIRFMAKRVLSASVGGSLFFFAASSTSITNNLLKRSSIRSTVFGSIAPPLIMWFSTIGSLCFICSMFYVFKQLISDRGTFGKKVMLFTWKNLTSLGQISNLLWLIGSLAYMVTVHAVPDIVKLRLFFVGGLSYLIGAVFSIISFYRGSFAQIIQTQEVMCKLRALVTLDERSDKEDASIVLDKKMCSSDISLQVKRRRRHRRLSSCSIINLDDIISVRTAVTEQMSDEGSNSNSTSITGRDFQRQDSMPETTRMYLYQDCSEVYSVLEPVNLDIFLEIWRAMSQGGTKSLCHDDIFQYVTENSRRGNLPLRLYWHLSVCQKLLVQPAFYVAIMYAVAGVFFTVGVFDLGWSDSTLSNVFLSASCQYLCGSSYSLYQVWRSANSDWDLLQSCRLSLLRKASD